MNDFKRGEIEIDEAVDEINEVIYVGETDSLKEYLDSNVEVKRRLVSRIFSLLIDLENCIPQGTKLNKNLVALSHEVEEVNS